MRNVTHTPNAGETSADRQTVIGPDNENPDREDSPVVQSVMQLGVNGCLPYSYSTRMRIIRNIRSPVCPADREDRYGSVGDSLAEFSYMAAFEGFADLPWSAFLTLRARGPLSPIAGVEST